MSSPADPETPGKKPEGEKARPAPSRAGGQGSPQSPVPGFDPAEKGELGPQSPAKPG